MNKKVNKQVYLKDREVAAAKAKKVIGGGSPKLLLVCADGEHFKVGAERGIIAI